MRVQDDDGQELIREIEEKRQGKLGWRTFSTWYADTDGVIRDRGVFLYLVNNVFWFEDFEAHPQIFGFEIKPKKTDAPYIKFESSFTANQIKDMYLVSKRSAKNYAEGFSNKLPKANLMTRLFSQVVTAVEFEDSSFRFFEVFGNDFRNQVNKLREDK